MGIFDGPFFSGPSPLARLLGGGSGPSASDQYNQISQSRKAIRSLASQLDPENQASALAAINVSRQLPLKQRQQLLGSTYAALPQLVIQNAGSAAALRTQQQQTQVGSAYLQDHLKSLISSGDAQAAFTRNLIPSLPASFQPIAELQAQQQADYGRRLADAYLQQYQAQPLYDYYQRQLAAQGKSIKSSGGSSASSGSLYSTLGQ